MSIILKSFIGTLAAVSMLACTAGAALYSWHCMHFAIHDAVAQHFAEMHSGDAMYHLGMDSPDGAPVGCAEFEDIDQPSGGAPIDSKIVAILIDELAEASPEEREAWTRLLRHPGSHESYLSFFAHYHRRAPQDIQTSSQQVQAPWTAERPPVSTPESSPEAEFPEAGNSRTTIRSAIEALQTAKQLLLERAMIEDLSELCQLRERLIDKQPPRRPTEQQDDSRDSPTNLPE